MKKVAVTFFGTKLKVDRESADYSLQELADKTSLSASYLSKVETGAIKSPRGSIIVRLSRIFGWEVADLYECFLSEDEVTLERRIMVLERELRECPDMNGAMKVMREMFCHNMRGKKFYYQFLQEYKLYVKK